MRNVQGRQTSMAAGHMSVTDNQMPLGKNILGVQWPEKSLDNIFEFVEFTLGGEKIMDKPKIGKRSYKWNRKQQRRISFEHPSDKLGISVILRRCLI